MTTAVPVTPAPSSPPAALLQAGMRARAGGDFARAERLLRAAVAGAEAARPLDAGMLAGTLNALGLVCKDLARHDEGRACYERALALLRGSPEAFADEIATLHHNLAGMAHACRDFAAAEPIARRGLAIRAHAAEPRPQAMAADMIALGAILDGLARFEEAERLYLDAVAVLERAGGAQRDAGADGDLAAALNNLGAHYACRERYEEAIVFLDRALTAKRRVLGDTHPDVAVTLHNLAVSWRRRGDAERALRLLLEAEALFVATLGEAHPRTVRCREQRARWRGAAADSTAR